MLNSNFYLKKKKVKLSIWKQTKKNTVWNNTEVGHSVCLVGVWYGGVFFVHNTYVHSSQRVR